MKAGKIASMLLVLMITVVATVGRMIASSYFALETSTPSTRLWAFVIDVGAVTAVVLIPLGIILDRSLANLGRYIEGSSSTEKGSARGLRLFRPITRAFTGAVDQFQKREQALRNQLGDLEIRHRVSEAERRQIEAVMHALRDAVLVTDAFDEIVMANQAAATILGFDLSKAIHRSIDAMIPDQRIRRLIREARETANFSDARHVEYAIGSDQSAGDGAPKSVNAESRSQSDSSARVFDVTLACVENHKKEVGGVVTILHDLTREREVSEMKSDFVSKASHELRTPLSSIRAYVEMLVDGEANDEKARVEFYRIIQGETDRLGRLIDNMLNISRIEAGIVQIDRENVDIKALAGRAISTLEPQAKEKKISLHWVGARAVGVGQGVSGRARKAETPASDSGAAHNTSAGAPPSGDLCTVNSDLCVEGDPDMLYQVVLNLVSNAVKYTPDGGRVTIGADSDNLTRSVVVTVSDTGLGIPPDSIGKLFDKFFRVENYKRVAKGTGLGLSLCKHIIETVHHGQIGVESKLGMGSKFWFSVPMRYAGGDPIRNSPRIGGTSRMAA